MLMEGKHACDLSDLFASAEKELRTQGEGAELSLYRGRRFIFLLC